VARPFNEPENQVINGSEETEVEAKEVKSVVA